MLLVTLLTFIAIHKMVPFSKYRPDSSVGRASAFRAGGRGFASWPHYTKGVKIGTSSSPADARIKGVVLGR